MTFTGIEIQYAMTDDKIKDFLFFSNNLRTRVEYYKFIINRTVGMFE